MVMVSKNTECRRSQPDGKGLHSSSCDVVTMAAPISKQKYSEADVRQFIARFHKCQHHSSRWYACYYRLAWLKGEDPVEPTDPKALKGWDRFKRWLERSQHAVR